MNHTRFPKEDHLTDWARRDNKVTKGDSAGCETWCLALREERGRMVFENRFSEEVFRIESEKVKGDWKKLHKEGLLDLYSSAVIIWVINWKNVQ